MISVIMPYWNRLELLTRSLDRMGELYPDYDMEIVIADDGSEEECITREDVPYELHSKRFTMFRCAVEGASHEEGFLEKTNKYS